jgi:hypothetical protein
VAAIDDGLGGALLTLEREGLAVNEEIFVVGAGGYEDCVAVGCGVDAGLDGGLVGGYVDDGGVRPGRCQSEEQNTEGLKQGGGAQRGRLGSGMSFFVTLPCADSVKNASFGGEELN